MNSVFVVTKGDYSDYRISAMFSTRELAQEFIDREKAYNKARRWHSPFNEIEEWGVDDINVASVQDKIWWVLFAAGSADVEQVGYFNTLDEIEMIFTVGRNNERLMVHVIADSMERAVKVAMERRTIFLVNKEKRLMC